MLLALSLCSLARGEVSTMNIEFGGTKSGVNTYDVKADGAFVSTTDFAIGTMKFHSTLTGQFDKGKIVRYVAETDAPGDKVRVEWNGLNVKVTRAEKTNEVPLKFEGESYFGNLHPQLNVNMLRAVDFSKKESQKVKTLLLDSGVLFEPAIMPLKEKSSKAGVAKFFEVGLGQVAAQYATDSSGRVVAMDVSAQKLRFVAAGWESLFVDPLASYPELSQPVLAVTTERNVKMKTRDGVELAMDIIRPTAPGRYPVILTRTPYGRGAATVDGSFFASRGYVYIAQDCRGRGDSRGAWDPFVNERKDGFDAIDWASKQSWSDGKVGMIGASYGGLVQWAAAVEKHPALKAIIPQVSPPDAMRNIPYDMGTFFLYGNLWWAKIVRDQAGIDMSSMASPLPHPDKFATLPLSKVDDAVLGYNVPIFDKWLEREGLSKWAGFDWSSQVGKTDVPALHISGWWDGDLIGTQTNWASLRAAKRPNQWLIYGPWTHAFNTTSSLGDVDYGPTAILELDSLYLRWFDTWLKGKSVGLAQVPKVRAFVTGANKWLVLDDWPSTKSAEKTLYLSAEAPANGKYSRGELRDSPALSQEPSRYTYNPARAKIPKEFIEMDPASATTVFEVKDEDEDLLVFRSAPFPRATAIGGPITLDLKFQTSARDTDFYAFIVDIDEKGSMRSIGRPGKIRAAYLGGFDKPRPLTPGKTYSASIELWDTAHEFKAGHRVGLMIMSGMFPMFARNLGTAEPIKNATRMIVQSNTILHDRKNPSTLRFRVLY